jgi:hypothetical protein
MSPEVETIRLRQSRADKPVVDATGKTLAERGLDVEVCPMKEVYDLTPY